MKPYNPLTPSQRLLYAAERHWDIKHASPKPPHKSSHVVLLASPIAGRKAEFIRDLRTDYDAFAMENEQAANHEPCSNGVYPFFEVLRKQAIETNDWSSFNKEWGTSFYLALRAYQEDFYRYYNDALRGLIFISVHGINPVEIKVLQEWGLELSIMMWKPSKKALLNRLRERLDMRLRDRYVSQKEYEASMEQGRRLININLQGISRDLIFEGAALQGIKSSRVTFLDTESSPILGREDFTLDEFHSQRTRFLEESLAVHIEGLNREAFVK